MKTSPESKTDTTDKWLEAFNKAAAALKEISTKIPEAEKTFDPVSYWVKSMKDNDVILEYKIIAHVKGGELFNIEGMNNLPRLFDDSMLPEAPTNFESTFNASIVRPALNAFMKAMQDKIEDIKRSSFTSPAQLTLQPNTQIDTQEFISD
jgi:hypothetical protein